MIVRREESCPGAIVRPQTEVPAQINFAYRSHPESKKYQRESYNFAGGVQKSRAPLRENSSNMFDSKPYQLMDEII